MKLQSVATAGSLPNRGFFTKVRSGRKSKTLAGGGIPANALLINDRAARRRAVRESLRPVQPVPSPGPSRIDRRAPAATTPGLPSSIAGLLGLERSDKAAIKKKAYLAGCHGKSVAPLEADRLLLNYLRQTGRKDLTPAQARRFDKARRAEVSA